MPTVFDDLPDVAPDAAPVASVNPFDDLPDLAPGHVAPPRPIPMANEIDPGHVAPPMPIPMASERGFDPREESFMETMLSPKRWAEAGGDVAAATGRGVVGLGESVVGAANLLPSFDPERGVYFGGAGATLEHLTGYDPQTAKEEISRIESPSLKKARANVQKSEGFAGTVKAILQNPQTIPAGVAESLPSMMGGAAVARGAMAAAPALSAIGASAFGEGAITAAQQLEQARQAQPDRTLDLDEASVSVASGAATGLISLFGGKLAARLGLEDIDTLLAKNVLPARKSAVALRILGGAIQEGLLEEFPQSLQEAIAQNLASGKPWDSGVVRDGIEGALQGMAMGAVSNIQRGPPSAGETAGELLGEAIKGSHLDLNVLNEVAVNRTLPPPRMPLREGERVEMGPEVGGVQGEGVNITTGPSRARVVRPAQPTGNVFEALPDVEPESPAFNVGEATPVLKNFLGRKFRTGDGFIGELKREGDRFVLVAGNTIHELPASGPDATADDAGIAMLRKSATEPSRLQVSRKQAKLRQLANWARKFPTPPPALVVAPPVAGQPVAKPAVQDLHPAHKALINAVLKNMALKGPSNAEILATIEQLPLTRRMLEAQITRMEAGGATAKETEFYYTALDRMEKYENRYLEGVTGKTYPRNREAGAIQPPTPQPVSPAEGASNAGAAVPPVAPAVSVTTPVTEEPQAEPDKPLTKAEREQHSKDNKEFRALFDEWGVQLGFIQDPNMFYSRREPGGDTASIAHNIRRARARKAAFESVIKYFGGDVQFKTHRTFSQILPKLKAYIAEFNRADEDISDLPDDVNTDFLPTDETGQPPKLRPGEKKTGELFQGDDQPFNLAGEKATDAERVAREKAEAERKAKEAEEAAKKAQMNLPVLDEPKKPDEPPPPPADEQPPNPPTPPAPAPQAPAQSPTPEKLVSDDLARKLEERIKARLNKNKPPEGPSGVQASSEGLMLGAEEQPTKPKKVKLDPSTFSDAVDLGVNYIQSGYHKFEDFSKQMLEVFGPVIEGHLNSIYETARATIELPRSQSAKGRSPGLQPGLKPPGERIITARADLTPKFDEAIIPDWLRKHLDPHQRQGAAAAIRSLEEQGGFLNADGTGTGKTRQALTVAAFYASQGKKVIIVTKNETIKPNWATDEFGGSYKSDAAAMNFDLKLARDGFVRPGQVGITTYQNLKSVKNVTDKGTVLIFDEAHALKNDSQQAKHANEAVAKASKVMFMTATPGDKAEHIYYLAPIGIMEGKTLQEQMENLGLKVRTVEKLEKNERGEWRRVKSVKWSVNPKMSKSERRKRFNELFDRLTKQGRIIKREISLDGVDIKRFDLTLPDEAHQLQSDILAKALEVWEKADWKSLNGLQRAIVLGHQRRQLEPYKISPAVLLAKRELEAGRQVVLFVARVNESEVGFNKKIKNPFGGESMTVREVLMSSEGTAKSLREALHEQGIHDIAEIHGNSDQSSLEAMADFQSGKKRVVIATIESGGTGINLDDIVGNRPRTMIVVTAPFDAVGNVQAAGRIWRLKTLSASNMYYLMGDTAVDDWNFGIIGEKMKQLGAVVQGQTSKLDVDNTEEVTAEDFDVDDSGPKALKGEFPEMDWKPRVMGKGVIKYVADATDEFFDWWNANGRTQNPYGLTIVKRGENDWIVWSDKPIVNGQPETGDEGEPQESGELEGIAGASSGLGATTTPSPVTTSTLPPKSQREIITDIARALNIPIRFGRLVTRKAGGYFRPVSRYITSKRADDIPVVAHEAGHAIDHDFGIRNIKALQQELATLGDPASYPGSRSSWTASKSADYQLGEGFAEFMRYWFTNPTFAKKEAPKTWAHFEGILAANVDLGALLRKSQSDILIWQDAPDEARKRMRFRSQVSRGDDPLRQIYTLSQLTRDLVDDLHIMRLAESDALNNAGAGSLLPSDRAYLLARNLKGSSGMAETFIRNGTVNFNTKEVTLGNSLEDALKPVAGRTADFSDWILAVRAMELMKQGKETGFLPQDVHAVYSKFKDDKAFQEAFQKVQLWQDNLLNYAQDSGLVTAEAVREMRKMNHDYVPYHRVFEVGAGEAPAISGGGTGKGLQVGRPSSLRGMHGSTRQVIDPLETMVKNAFALIHASEKAAINVAVANWAHLPNMGKWVRRTDVPVEKLKVDLGRIRRALAESILHSGLTSSQKQDIRDALKNLEDVPDELLLAFWRSSPFTPFGQNIIRVVRDGKPEFYQLDKNLFETFNALDLDDPGMIMRIASAPAQWLRAGVVLEPGFAFVNVLRDMFASAVISKYGLWPVEATIKGFAAMINNPKLVAEWAASGGKSAIEANFFDRKKLQHFLRHKIAKNLTPAERALIWTTAPIRALRFITAVGEDATRIGEFKTAYDSMIKSGVPPGEARRLAAFEARDRQDFAKGGAKTKMLRHLTPFWNASLQANVKFAQSLKDPKTRYKTLLQGFTYITLPKLIEQALNWDDDDYWERPQWERDLFFLIPIGKSESGHTRFLRIPTPFEVGLIFGTMPGRILQSIKQKDPAAMTGFPGLVLKNIIPNPVPPPVTTAFEAIAGKQGWDFWQMHPIVPERIAKLPTPEQWTEQTTATAKAIGQTVGVSPMKVDHIISKSFGGMGRLVTRGETPRKRFITQPLERANQSTDDFYKFLDIEEGKDALRKRDNPGTETPPVLTALHQYERTMNALRKSAREAKTDEDKLKFQTRLFDVTKKAADWYRQQSK